MGVGDFMHTLTDTAKTYTPDLSSVYSYSSNTISKVDNVVRVDIVPKLTEIVPDVRSCGNIGQKMNDYMHTLTDTVKTYTPDLSSVYSYSSNTISKVDNVVPKLTNILPDVKSCGKIGEKMNDYMHDQEYRAMVGKFAWDLGKNAVVLGMHEGIKLVPGGSFVHQAVLQSLPKEKDENLIKEVKTLQTRIYKLEKHANESRKSYEAGAISSSNIEPNSQTASILSSTTKFQEPEDVIRVFMMKGFVGRDINQQIVENLMVPGVGKYRK